LRFLGFASGRWVVVRSCRPPSLAATMSKVPKVTMVPMGKVIEAIQNEMQHTKLPT
jgi:hypothetical protein